MILARIGTRLADFEIDQPGKALEISHLKRTALYRFFTTDLVDIHNIVYILCMKSRDVIKALEAEGWEQVAQKGSHRHFKHPTIKGRVTVPHPKRDLPIGTLKSIEKQSGLKLT